MVINDFYCILDSALREEGLTQEDIDFVHTLIKEDSRDSNLKRMDIRAFIKLEDRGIEMAFRRACKKKNIEWDHNIDPAY